MNRWDKVGIRVMVGAVALSCIGVGTAAFLLTYKVLTSERILG